MSLRTKLLLLSLLTLVLPWAGWQYAQQMETTLRRGQEDALLTTAQVLSRVVASEPELLYRVADLRSNFDPARGDLFAPLIVTRPLLDGFADEWPQPARAVPGFGAGTRPAQLIERMFDNMRPEQPMIRWNWSLYGDDALHHPHDSPPNRFGGGAKAERVFLRVERQTLRRLPVSGDIVFTIRIAVDPLAALERAPDSARIAAAIISQLQALSPEQLDYKGMTDERDGLIARLADIAASGRTK